MCIPDMKRHLVWVGMTDGRRSTGDGMWPCWGPEVRLLANKTKVPDLNEKFPYDATDGLFATGSLPDDVLQRLTAPWDLVCDSGNFVGVSLHVPVDWNLEMKRVECPHA